MVQCFRSAARLFATDDEMLCEFLRFLVLPEERAWYDCPSSRFRLTIVFFGLPLRAVCLPRIW